MEKQYGSTEMQERLGEEKIKDFLEALSSKSPVPGGGGAVALSAALGFSLALMVGNLTLGKKKYADYEECLQRRMKEWEEAKQSALRFAKADEEVFYPLSQAYSLPKETEEEKKHYEEQMEECLKKASLVPLHLLELCAGKADSFLELAKNGSRIAISDVGVGASFLITAMRGAALNVRINTNLMKNAETKKKREDAVEEALQKLKVLEEAIQTVEKAI